MLEKFLTPIQIILLAAVVVCGQTAFKFIETSDTYFIMNLGRYILEHGIPHVDPFTIHENLHLVAQQWLSGVIFWEAYKNFGVDGILAVDFVFGLALLIMYWRLCLFASGGNKAVSFALTFVTALLATPEIIPRPQIFSTPVLLGEVFLLEKFTRTAEFKFLLPLPILSVVLINLHAAVWLMMLVISLPFLFVRSERHAKFLLAAMIGIFVGGLINPYGFEAMTYVLRSYGVELINTNIKEMFTPSAHDIFGKGFYLMEAALIVSLAKFSVPWRYIFLSGGLTYLAIMHERNAIIFYFLATFPMAYAWREFTPPKFLAEGGAYLPLFFLLVFANTAMITTLLEDGLEKFSLPLEILLAAAIIVTAYNLLVLKFEGRLLHPKILPRKNLMLFAAVLIVGGILFTTQNHGGKEADGDFTSAMKVLLKSERAENIRLYAGQGYGGLAGMLGIRYYIDSRSEVFMAANNGRADIFAEYLNFKAGFIGYKDFFARYKFTHIFVTNGEPFIFDLLTKDKNFRTVYESERVEGTNVIRCKVFVPKEFRQ